VKLYKNGAIQPTLFLDVTARVAGLGGERGLLGLAFHPGFNDSASVGYRKLYTYNSELSSSGTADFAVPEGGSTDHHNVIAEWQVGDPPSSSDVVSVASRREVLRVGHPDGSHNGGEISFRPSDGYLYIGFGDGGHTNDVGAGHTPSIGNGQDTTNLLGDILRIDPIAAALTPASPDPQSANGKYRNPATNPFIGVIAGADEIFAYGFRNPYRFSFDPVNDRLIVGDVGQYSIEEVDIVENGKNYGWNRKEGSFLFDPGTGGVSPDPSPNPNLINPVAEYDHGDGISVIGGFVYRGTALTALTGKYVFGDFLKPSIGTGRLFYADLSTGKIQEFQIGVPNRLLGVQIKGFGEDPNGEIYVLTDAGGSTGGKVQKLVPIPVSPALVNLSTRGDVGTGDNVLIGGFILTGSTTKEMIVRALGPSLTGAGVPGALANPTLDLHDGNGAVIDSNDDWQSHARQQDVDDAGLAPGNSFESAIARLFQPGPYTAIMRGVNDGTGIGLVELYDVDQGAPTNAVNISARGQVGVGDNVMIGGFIVAPGSSRTVVVRALGPSLTAAGVPGVLQNPAVELRQLVGNSSVFVAGNDDWQTPPANQTAVSATGLAPANSNEAALVATLAPGSYTPIVTGVGNTTGVALVEIYFVP
jgi:glucose/arabinose dehydrogenase